MEKLLVNRKCYLTLFLSFIFIIGCSKEEADILQQIVGKHNIIHIGENNPSDSLGVIGDVFVQRNAVVYFGPKTEKGWGEAHNLNGESFNRIRVGVGQPKESVGTKGDYYLDVEIGFMYGPKPYPSSWIGSSGMLHGVYINTNSAQKGTQTKTGNN